MQQEGVTRPVEGREARALPKKATKPVNLEPGAVARFKEMLTGRKEAVKKRIEETTGEVLMGQRRSESEATRAQLVEKASSGHMEDIIEAGREAEKISAAQREQMIVDRFTTGGEKREMLLVIEAMGKFRLELANEYPEYFKLNSWGEINFNIARWFQEHEELRTGQKSGPLADEIRGRRNEIKMVVRDRMTNLVGKVLKISNGDERNLDLLFLSPQEQEVGLLFLNTLETYRAYYGQYIEEENVSPYKAVLNALVKAKSDYGVSSGEMQRILKYGLRAEAIFLDSFAAKEKQQETPSMLSVNSDLLFNNFDLRQLEALGVGKSVLDRLEKGLGLGEGSTEERERALVDVVCKYVEVVRYSGDPNDPNYEKILGLVLGAQRPRYGLVESPISTEGKQRIIRAVFESIINLFTHREKVTDISVLDNQLSETCLSRAIFKNNWPLFLETVSQSIQSRFPESSYLREHGIRIIADISTQALVKNMAGSSAGYATFHVAQYLKEYQPRFEALQKFAVSLGE